MTNQEIIYEYVQILLEKRRNYSNILFNPEYRTSPESLMRGRRRDTEQNQRTALVIIRYAVEEILGWSPKQVYHCLTYEILEKLHLCPLLQYLNFPPELSRKNDVYYIAHLLYPQIFPIDIKDLCIKHYQKILANDSLSFPKGYFAHAEGLLRAILCLQYALNNYIHAKNEFELYEMFADEPRIRETLKKYKLLEPCDLFFNKPIAYLQYALPEQQKNQFLYQYFCFLDHYEQFRAEKRKKREEEERLKAQVSVEEKPAETTRLEARQ